MSKCLKNNSPESLNAYWEAKIEKYQLKNRSIKVSDKTKPDNYGVRKELYNKLRTDYNSSTERDYRDLFLLSCYSINHLIRFNSDSQFNASSGNDSYNEKNYKAVQETHAKLQNVVITENDATELKLDELEDDTFIYCDVPYLNTNAIYNGKMEFGGWNIDNDYKLFKLLEEADKKGIRWGLSNVFENRGKRNEHLIKWCEEKRMGSASS